MTLLMRAVLTMRSSPLGGLPKGIFVPLPRGATERPSLSASFIIQSIDISYGRGLQIKPPPGFADFTNLQFAGVPVLAIFTVLGVTFLFA